MDPGSNSDGLAMAALLSLCSAAGDLGRSAESGPGAAWLPCDAEEGGDPRADEFFGLSGTGDIVAG